MHKMKLLLGTILALSVAHAGMQENLVNLIKTKTQQEVSVKEVHDLKSDPNIKIAILQDSLSKNKIPVITNQNGKVLFILTNVFFADNNDDAKLVGQILQDIQSENDKQINSAALNKLFESIPSDYVLKLDSTTKNNTKVTYIVSDPMCPHCQEELRNIDERLKDTNVYLVLVSYMGQESLKKASIILEKAKTLQDTKQKVELLQQVYAVTYKTQNPRDKEMKKVENITKKIADSGLIQGVPFIYEYSK